MGNYKGCDMIVNLTTLPEQVSLGEGIKIKRAMAGEKELVVNFIKENFQIGWAGEAECALMQVPGQCFIATENGKILGFACYDATAKGFFGPTGVISGEQGRNIGKALLLRTLAAMREVGYGYAIIGWVSDAEMFYRKTVSAEFISNGIPQNSVYSNLTAIDKRAE